MGGPPGPDDLPLIGQICEAVDGLPLAIELAAARTRWFSLAEILQQSLQTAVRADPDLRLLRSGSQLIYYWYHRRRVIEARHWLPDGPSGVGGTTRREG